MKVTRSTIAAARACPVDPCFACLHAPPQGLFAIAYMAQDLGNHGMQISSAHMRDYLY
jgi:hypothetical protein